MTPASLAPSVPVSVDVDFGRVTAAFFLSVNKEAHVVGGAETFVYQDTDLEADYDASW